MDLAIILQPDLFFPVVIEFRKVVDLMVARVLQMSRDEAFNLTPRNLRVKLAWRVKLAYVLVEEVRHEL